VNPFAQLNAVNFAGLKIVGQLEGVQLQPLDIRCRAPSGA
jgi:hypothetical protein